MTLVLFCVTYLAYVITLFLPIPEPIRARIIAILAAVLFGLLAWDRWGNPLDR